MICDTLAAPLRKMTLRGANSLAKHHQPQFRRASELLLRRNTYRVSVIRTQTYKGRVGRCGFHIGLPRNY
jgi:hypothetical protein